MAINYQMDVINPFQAALQGYGAGAQILQQERNAALQQQQMGQQNQLFALQMEEAQVRRAEVQRKIKEAEEGQAFMAEVNDAMEAGTFSSAMIAEAMSRNKELGSFLQQERERLSNEEKQNLLNQQMSLVSAIEADNIPIAKNLFEEQALAAENSGDPGAAQVARGMAQQLDTKEGREIVRNTLLFTAGGILPDQFDKAYKNIIAAKKLPYEIRKLDAEAEEARNKNNGVLPQADIMKAETELRKEYTTAAKGYNETRAFYSQLLGAATQKSAAGDTALITLFRKVLDPTSVVRESEFAQTAEGGGLLQRLEASASGLVSGQKLTDAQRQDIVNTAKQFVDAANAYERERRSGFDYVISRNGLDPKAIYGLQPVGKVYQPGQAENIPDYVNMSMDQLKGVNTFTLTLDQARAYNEALINKIQQTKGAQ